MATMQLSKKKSKGVNGCCLEATYQVMEALTGAIELSGQMWEVELFRRSQPFERVEKFSQSKCVRGLT